MTTQPANSLASFRNFHAVSAEVLQEAFGEVVPNESQWPGDQYGSGILPRYQRPATSLFDRSDGRYLPVFQNEFDLAVIRAMGRLLAETAPGLVGGLRNMCNYTIGEGYSYTATREATSSISDEQAAPLVNAVQREIEVLLDDTEFISGFDREIHNHSVVDGESILEVKPTPAGKVRIYRREPDELRRPATGRDLEDWVEATYGIPCSEFVTSWSFGILTRQDQPDEPLAYHLVSDESGVNWEVLPADRVVHIKRNVPRNAKRGFSDFYPIEADSTRAEKLRRNMAEGAAVQSAIAYVRQHVQGVTKQAVDDIIGGNKAGTTQQHLQGGGSRTKNVVNYRPGTIVDLSAGLEYKPGPMGSDRAQDFMVVAQYVQRMQAVRWSMPEYMFSGDASNANYSSTMVAESPFVKSCEAEQRFYSRYFVAAIWKALKIRFDLGAFRQFGMDWCDIEALIKIKAQCPTVATRDPKASAEAAQTAIQAGFLSPKTACEESGHDWNVEQANGLTPQPAPGAAAPVTTPPAGSAPAPPAGGEFANASTLQWTRNIKAIESTLERFKAGTITRDLAHAYLTSVGIAPDRADRLLDGQPDAEVDQAIASPVTESLSAYGYCPMCGATGESRERRLNGNDKCENGHVYPSASSVDKSITESIQGDVVPEKNPSSDIPSKIPSREKLVALTAAAIQELIEELREAVLDDNKPRQREITKEIEQIQRDAGFASMMLGKLGVFDPSIHGEPPHGKEGLAAVIEPKGGKDGDS